jgi:hypothetical protein
VVDNLPTLNVRGKASENGPVQTFQVKAAGQLPEDFTFVNERERLLFTQAIANQELRAERLQQDYFSTEQRKRSDEYSERENRDIRRDMGALQREGKLPRFQLQPDDPKFDQDEGVKEAQKVIDYMNRMNESYLEDFNKNGGVLYHVGFRDAWRLLQTDEAAEQRNNPQKQEDKERRQVTRQMAGSRGAPSNGTSKPRAVLRPNESLADMVERMSLD